MELPKAINFVYLEIVLFLVDDTHGCAYPSDWPLKKNNAYVCRAVDVMPFGTIATNLTLHGAQNSVTHILAIGRLGVVITFHLNA